MKVNLAKVMYTAYIENTLFILSLFYAFFYLHFDSQVRPLILIVFIVQAVLVIAKEKRLLHSAPMFFMVGAVIITLLNWVLTSLQVPDMAKNSPRIEHLTNKLMFIPLALLLVGNTKKTFVFWMVAALSAFSVPWLSGEGAKELPLAFSGVRTGFGRHVITMGMIYACILLGALVFFKDYIYRSKNVFVYVLWFFMVVAALFGVYASQTRAIYLGLLVDYILVVITILLLSCFSWGKYKHYLVKILIFSVFVFIAAFCVYKLGFLDSVINKFLNELQTFKTNELGAVEKHSAGLRVHFWMDAWNWISQRPLTGWGKGANSMIHQEAGNFFGKGYFVTLHNDFLEILLAYGALGVAFFISLIVWLSIEINNAWKNLVLNTSMLVFYYLFMVFYLINGLFMSVLFFDESMFLWNVVLAGYLGFVIKNKYFYDNHNENC